MSVSILASARAKHQLQHQEALYSGLKKLGVPANKAFSLTHTPGPVVACWGWRNGLLMRERGYEVLVMERGYIGDRFSYSSLGWNGLNGHAEFPEYPDDGGKRFRQLGVEIKPWKTNGEYALILGQVPKDASLQGKDMEPWYRGKAIEIWETHGLPVHFRPHPDLKKAGITQRIEGTLHSSGTLEEALSGAAFTVCYNSNSSVDSVLAGVPCIVGDKGSMAWDVCGKSISEIVRPDREEWAAKLSYRQWNIAEIESGEALSGLICKLGA